MSTVRLDHDQLEQLANMIADKLQATTSPDRLLDAQQLAERLGVNRSFVYRHADKLGARRIGGPNGRLRFEADQGATTIIPGGPSVSDPEPRRRQRKHPVGHVLQIRE